MRAQPDFQGCTAGVWLHGEAVAAGTVMAADMSHRLGWIERDVLDRTVRLLQRAKLPIAAPAVSPPVPGLIRCSIPWHRGARILGGSKVQRLQHGKLSSMP